MLNIYLNDGCGGHGKIQNFHVRSPCGLIFQEILRRHFLALVDTSAMGSVSMVST